MKIIITILIFFLSISVYSQSMHMLVGEFPKAEVTANEEHELIYVAIEGQDEFEISRIYIYSMSDHSNPIGIMVFMDISWYGEMLREVREDPDFTETEPGMFEHEENTVLIYTKERFLVILILYK